MFSAKASTAKDIDRRVTPTQRYLKGQEKLTSVRL